MTLSMDRVSEFFDFDEFTCDNIYGATGMGSITLSDMSHDNVSYDQSPGTTPSPNPLESSFGSSSTGDSSKVMLDMDNHSVVCSPKPTNQTLTKPSLSLVNDVDCDDFPFDDVLSLDMELGTQEFPQSFTNSSVFSPGSLQQTSNGLGAGSPPGKFTTGLKDSSPKTSEIMDYSPLTPEKIALASVDFKKLSSKKQPDATTTGRRVRSASHPVNVTITSTPMTRQYSAISYHSTKETPMSKQPLPPEGIKITRYPIKTQSSSQQPVQFDQTAALILRLQRELKSAKQEIIRYQRSMEDWKNTAHYALQTAKRIKERLDSQNNPTKILVSKREQNINSGIFSSKLPVKTTQITFKESEVEGKRSSFKKRSASEPETPIQCKIARTNSHTPSRDLSLWLKSNKVQRIHDNVSSLRMLPQRQYKGALSNNVKLALRAKVCKSTKQNSFTEVFDIYKEVKDLLSDVSPMTPSPPSVTSPQTLMTSSPKPDASPLPVPSTSPRSTSSPPVTSSPSYDLPKERIRVSSAEEIKNNDETMTSSLTRCESLSDPCINTI